MACSAKKHACIAHAILFAAMNGGCRRERSKSLQ